MATLIYLGHSTVLLESNEGKRILIDPFLKSNPLCPEQFHVLKDIDIICLTHGHQDHTADVLEAAQASGATVCATFELASLLQQDGLAAEQLEMMNKGGRIERDGIAISLVQAFHSSSYTTKDSVTHYAGEACGVVIELEDGNTVYHAGDTCLFSDMELIAERFAPQVALLPIGDRFTMGPEDAATAVEVLQPQVAIPIHFGTFELLSGTPEEFQSLCSESETEVVVLEPGEEFEL